MKRLVEQALCVLIVALGLTAVFDLPAVWFGYTVFPQQYLGAFWGLVSCLAFPTQPRQRGQGDPLVRPSGGRRLARARPVHRVLVSGHPRDDRSAFYRSH